MPVPKVPAPSSSVCLPMPLPHVMGMSAAPVPDTTPVKRHTALRGFDLSSGAQKLRWNLPGDNSTCNDFSIGPDKALYISDTANSKIYKLPAGATNADLFLEDHALYGIDGITFLDG